MAESDQLEMKRKTNVVRDTAVTINSHTESEDLCSNPSPNLDPASLYKAALNLSVK